MTIYDLFSDDCGKKIELHKGDCLEVMKNIPDKSLDMIFCDLPYGKTACKWDSIIPFEPLWKQYKRIIKDNGAIVLTASQPFTSALVMSNQKMFRTEWIYQKLCASNFAQAKYQPMKEHENVLVFSKEKTRYFPIRETRKGSGKQRVKYPFSEKKDTGEFVGKFVGKLNRDFKEYIDDLRYPSSVRVFNNRAKGDRGLHPTQKPVSLCEYFINTYTQKGDLVMDNCMGSGSTGVACINTGRNFIGIEINSNYFNIAKQRIYEAEQALRERETK